MYCYKAGSTELLLNEVMPMIQNGEFVVNSNGIYQPVVIFKKVGTISGVMPYNRFHSMGERAIRHNFANNHALMAEFDSKIDYRNLATNLKYSQLMLCEKRTVVPHLAKERGISVEAAAQLIEEYAAKDYWMPDNWRQWLSELPDAAQIKSNPN